MVKIRKYVFENAYSTYIVYVLSIAAASRVVVWFSICQKKAIAVGAKFGARVLGTNAVPAFLPKYLGKNLYVASVECFAG